MIGYVSLLYFDTCLYLKFSLLDFFFSDRFFKFKMAAVKQGKDDEGKFVCICSNTPARYGILLSRTSSSQDSLERGGYRKENPFYQGNLGNWVEEN